MGLSEKELEEKYGKEPVTPPAETPATETEEKPETKEES